MIATPALEANIPREAIESRKKLHRAISDLLFEYRDEIHHPNPRLAIDLGLFMVSQETVEEAGAVLAGGHTT